MSVYVDEARWPYGKMIMCHLLADTPAELLTMVNRIGVQTKWFQNKASAPHFDIARTKRQLAIAAGAIEIDRQQLAEILVRLRKSWPRDQDGWVL